MVTETYHVLSRLFPPTPNYSLSYSLHTTYCYPCPSNQISSSILRARAQMQSKQTSSLLRTLSSLLDPRPRPSTKKSTTTKKLKNLILNCPSSNLTTSSPPFMIPSRSSPPPLS